MPWVETVQESDARQPLRILYEQVRQRAGKIPNIARIQSLRPETTTYGFNLYCQLMDSPTGIARRERFLIATVVSKVNGCLY